MEVAVPPAVVLVAPAVNDVVPEGANHMALVASPEETTVTAAPPTAEAEAAKTVFWFVGATVSILKAIAPLFAVA